MSNKNKEHKARLTTKLLTLILFAVILIATSKFWLPLPVKFLLVKDNLQKADCLVPLQGDPYFRFKKAVELYNQGYAKNIVVSVTPEREEELRQYYNFNYRILGLAEPSAEEFTLKAFKYFGKNTRDIHFTSLPITSTYDEAIATKKLMQEKDFKSLILVTSTYHTRRALLIFKLVFKGTGIRIYHSTAENELYNPSRWWAKERDVNTVIREYVAIVQNIFYHFILQKKRTSFDTY